MLVKLNYKNNDEDNELLEIDRVIVLNLNKEICFKIGVLQMQSQKNPLVHFVSYEFNCILSIYDGRGCDIVFFDSKNFINMYKILEPYFLDYDKELMEKRFHSMKNWND